MTTRAYSTLFACLYDQAQPVGSLGGGTHYSIMRTTQWRDDFGNSVDHPMLHDFAVIWDEDHDERVIAVIERLHMAGLLWPVVFIGEHQGGLSLLIHAHANMSRAVGDDYNERVQAICNNVNNDVWSCDFGQFHRDPANIDKLTRPSALINDRDIMVVAFLQGIDVSWNLGIKNGHLILPRLMEG